MRAFVPIVVVVGAIFLILAPDFGLSTGGPNPLTNTADPAGNVAGFWMGLWHGFTLLITTLISIFNNATTPYEVHNNGNWYNYGFLLGILILGGSIATATKK